jgi:prevent-host-death family protein
MRIVNVHEAKTHLSRLLDEVKAGQEIILAKMGKPYARLVPYDEASRVPLGFLRGEVGDEIFDPLPEEELSQWESPL